MNHKYVAHNAGFNTFVREAPIPIAKINPDWPYGSLPSVKPIGTFGMVGSEFSLIKYSSYIKLCKIQEPLSQSWGRMETSSHRELGRLCYGDAILSWIALNNSPWLEANDDSCC